MTGYDKSPDYGGRPVGRWTVAIRAAVILAALAVVAVWRLL
jgi:hypothetical protein